MCKLGKGSYGGGVETKRAGEVQKVRVNRGVNDVEGARPEAVSRGVWRAVSGRGCRVGVVAEKWVVGLFVSVSKERFVMSLADKLWTAC